MKGAKNEERGHLLDFRACGVSGMTQCVFPWLQLGDPAAYLDIGVGPSPAWVCAPKQQVAGQT